jgi:5-methyltetrahydropteroyltriglutamate--homocysteine methyltransferase
MRRSTDRILTTHTGSLPRPAELHEALIRRDRGEPVDAAALDAQIGDAVADVVRRQRPPASASSTTARRARSATRRT